MNRTLHRFPRPTHVRLVVRFIGIVLLWVCAGWFMFAGIVWTHSKEELGTNRRILIDGPPGHRTFQVAVAWRGNDGGISDILVRPTFSEPPKLGASHAILVPKKPWISAWSMPWLKNRSLIFAGLSVLSLILIDGTRQRRRR